MAKVCFSLKFRIRRLQLPQVKHSLARLSQLPCRLRQHRCKSSGIRYAIFVFFACVPGPRLWACFAGLLFPWLRFFVPNFLSDNHIGVSPLVVGPGFPRVSTKVIASISSGEFVELAFLLEEIPGDDAASFTLGDRELPQRPPKCRKEIKDISTWLQAFSVYEFVQTTYCPSRISDLLRYELKRQTPLALV